MFDATRVVDDWGICSKAVILLMFYSIAIL